LDAGHGERSRMWRMAMHSGDRALLTLHDREVHQDFARALLRAGELIAFEIDQAHLLWLHEAFRHQRRRAKRNVFADANGNVAAVAIDVSALPQAAADFANLELQIMPGRRLESGVEFGFRAF